MHFSFPFDPQTGVIKGPTPSPAYQDIAARAISDCMDVDPSIVAITPSTLYATGLASVFARFPDRCFDPGMEEQHAATMAVGMALSGTKPVLFYQSTFLQRAFDQMIHDICFANQDILILAVRSGFAGYDNPTHHGIYDLSYMRCLPNLSIYYPRNSHELYEMITLSLTSCKGPVLILMPYGPAESPSFVLEGSGLVMDTPEIIRTGKDGIVLAVGNKVTACDQAIDMLVKQGVFYGLVNLRKLKPLPEADLLELVRAAPHIVTVEEGVLEGGVGAAISAFMHQHRLSAGLTRVGLPCAFIEAGSNDELTAKYGLDAAGIARQIAVGRTLL
jgi:1-deoxy-D-xylulose-5-phosphate synthase